MQLIIFLKKNEATFIRKYLKSIVLFIACSKLAVMSFEHTSKQKICCFKWFVVFDESVPVTLLRYLSPLMHPKLGVEKHVTRWYFFLLLKTIGMCFAGEMYSKVIISSWKYEIQMLFLFLYNLRSMYKF